MVLQSNECIILVGNKYIAAIPNLKKIDWSEVTLYELMLGF